MHSDCLGIVIIPEIYKYVTSSKNFFCPLISDDSDDDDDGGEDDHYGDFEVTYFVFQRNNHYTQTI